MWHPTSQPVLIDTDIGDDVDDAFALALALRLPALRVCGITTVAGPVEQRARLAYMIANAAGQRGIPIAPGSSAMRDGRPGPARFSHGPLLAAAPPLAPAPAATDLILACARAAPPLTIIALGPLTNVAAALDRDPALARRARVVAMAGTLGPPYPDWNLRCDPAAARRVLDSGIPLTMVGMNVTLRSKMRAAQLHSLFASPDSLARLLARCVLAWRTWKRRVPFLHDALTVAVAADPALAALERRRVRVGWRGFSLASRGGGANALVCRDVDAARYNAMLEAALPLAPLPGTAGCGAWCRLLRLLA